VRGLRALREADAVVHDLLVHPSVLAEASADAEIVPVSRAVAIDGPPGDSAGDDAGERAGRLLRDLALAGRRVVRLKGGDPSVFARLAEEMRPLSEAGIAVEIVPGVTAALAASASAAIPLTSRTHASSLTLVTGHRAGGGESTLDLPMLAKLPGSLVFYMGVERLGDWSAALIAAGRPVDTPVVIVSRCGWPDETILRTTLAKASGDAEVASMTSPAVAIVGGVAGEGPATVPRDDGLLRRPSPDRAAVKGLAGRRVLLARAAGQSAELASLLVAHAAEPIECPAIRIEPPDSWKPLDDAIDAASSYDWVVFSSANGVRSFVERLRVRGLDARALGTARIAAVGAKTAEALSAAHLASDLVPEHDFRAEALADAFDAMPGPGRFLLVRADRGRDVLAGRLLAAGHDVVEVVGYRSVDVERIGPERMADLRKHPPDWLVVTSPAVAAAALRLFGEFAPGMRIATISPLTSEAVRRMGFVPAAEALQATAGAIVDAMVAREAEAGPARPVAQPADAADRP
jgi:uroporphyrinogen III methyltransferase/synthase